MELGGSGRSFINEVAKHDIAHAESHGGKIHAAIAQALDKTIIASATRQGAEVFRAVEDFENHAGVVGEASNDREVGLHEAGQAACGEGFEHWGKDLGATSGDEGLEIGNSESGRSQFCIQLFFRLTLEFVGTGQHDAGRRFVAAS